MPRLLFASMVLACSGCTLDFGIFEVRDGGSFDASVRDAGRTDAGRTDAGRTDAGRTDAGRDDAGRIDAGNVDAGNVDAGPGCTTSGVADCTVQACAGMPCDDGLRCTVGDVCTGGSCTGTTMPCPTDGCSTEQCNESTGTCVRISVVPDTTPCTGGLCCFGRCSNLQDSGNCAGCGLGCDEYSCSAERPARCVCDTNAGCPLGQTCIGNRCMCTSSAQCAAGQFCNTATGSCSY
jgi:hypothetical protein